MKLGAIAFEGTSGTHHEFNIYPVTSKFKPGFGGVYFITARKETEHHHHSHHKIYVGETDDLAGLYENHPMKEAFDSEGANCICVHATRDAAARKRICRELAEKYAPPCNAGETG